MGNRKRSRPVTEENSVECPFKISYVPGPSRVDQERHKNEKRKRDSRDDDKRIQIQISPFSPIGSFQSHDTMDMYYEIAPGKRWQDMTRYNSFVLNGNKYYNGSFVSVANESTVNLQKATSDGKGGCEKSNDKWVAHILEIRASDEHHVYARVYWMYWPDELPHGTIYRKKRVHGRQPYHGTNELIASNHMDIINVVSVTAPAIVNQWIESDDEEIEAALYWRQAYDCRKPQLSSVDILCECETPANPDKMLIGCSSSKCEQWMHHECLTHDILMQVYARLGTDKPHRTDGAVSNEEEAENVTCHLSPTCAEKKETIRTIDVQFEKSRERPKKKVERSKPYARLFEANLKMQDGPTAWEIRDLRESVTGGEKTWTEKVHCLICGAVID
ncbi:hypothetical protein FIE12Z_12313 [Fusarium flagelliforme]|uniref:BAH domain-containing protein n=1 Tax=Fusarium flagelliforme TaxID=2675880 RepID=A0A395M6D4_9HYPO|nr:hypothetical protein FIE12Z_12313 [Fusarium flagelliforme]